MFCDNCQDFGNFTFKKNMKLLSAFDMREFIDQEGIYRKVKNASTSWIEFLRGSRSNSRLCLFKKIDSSDAIRIYG